jgi:hypothetical protein
MIAFLWMMTIACIVFSLLPATLSREGRRQWRCDFTNRDAWRTGDRPTHCSFPFWRQAYAFERCFRAPEPVRFHALKFFSRPAAKKITPSGSAARTSHDPFGPPSPRF